MTLKRGVVLLVAAVLLAIVPTVVDGPGAKAPAAGAADGIKKIEHVIIIMQENRSFDHYFGTFPGADGLLKDGKLKKSIKCNPNPRTGKCMLPYVDHHDNGAGGPHTTAASRDSINGGKMDGYVKVTERQFCTKAENLRCGDFPIDVMGYHTQSDIRTTGSTRRTSCSRTACSSRSRRGACPHTCTWCRDGRRGARTTIRSAA